MSQKEILEESLNGELSTGESTELVRLKAIEGTPFKMLFKNGMFYVCWGKYLLTDGHAKEEDALAFASWENWEFILNVMFTVCSIIKNENS